MVTHPVVITGLGLASSLGEGRAAHAGRVPVVDAARCAPYPLHPLADLPMAESIPRREWRQMEAFQRLGVYAAGLALDDARARGLVPDLDLVVAAGGGERDLALDEQILAARPDERGRNAMIAAGLRPTLFLAQLPNLLAGSVSIVHGVGGSSRTLLGEEVAGAEALRIAHARIAAGTSQAVLVGASFVAERPDVVLLHAAGRALHRGPWQCVAERTGAVFGSAGVFLLLEEEAAALARGATPIARLTHIATDQGAAEGRLVRLEALRRPGGAVVSAASGAVAGEAALTPGAEFAADALGHSLEAAALMAVALAALGVASGAPRVEVLGCGAFAGEFAAALERAA